MNVLWSALRVDAEWTAAIVAVLLVVGWIGGYIVDKIGERRAREREKQAVPLPPPAYPDGKKRR